MRILLVNPNMTISMTERMAEIALCVAGESAEIVPLTAGRGFPYIASKTEAQIAGAIALEMIAEHQDGASAAIVAAFGDPGLKAAREIFDIPVVGMTEASVLSAAQLGDTFAVVTFTPFMTRWYEEAIATTGLGARSRGVRAARRPFANVENARNETRSELIELARSAAVEDGADLIILGGAPLAGLAGEIAAEVPALVIDPTSAATAQAIALASLADRRDYASRAIRPAPKGSAGLSEPLRALIAGEIA